MYSVLPAIVSVLFLVYGLYVRRSRGNSALTATFLLVCVTTFCWQFTWAILFCVRDPALGKLLAKTGYLFIVFLPTSLYHFVCTLTGSSGERLRIRLSYGLAALLALSILTTDWFVRGIYPYFFGFYPKAGILHPLHLLQTTAVMLRALYLLYRRYQFAVSIERVRLRYCLLSMGIYFFAAVDYLCNYGIEFYPPGLLFIGVSLGLIAQAIVRHNLLDHTMTAAATIAHEMRTPLATIRGQARGLARNLPELIAGYQHAVKHHDYPSAISSDRLEYMAELARHIETEVVRSNFIVDMVLASATVESMRKNDFASHSVGKCVADALDRYPFDPDGRARVTVTQAQDFLFHGSDVLLVYVLYNLLKNALRAIATAGRGEIEISFFSAEQRNFLKVSDTGPGIPRHVLPHVFDPFYTTRRSGAGMGLAFCQRVVTAFGGRISCESVEGASTTFVLEFPAVQTSARQAA